jgi:hypothetical protein
MKWRHHRQRSRSFLTLLLGATVLGLITFFREEPSLRRYLRIARM